MKILSEKPAQGNLSVEIERLVRWDCRTGNALCFADISITEGNANVFRYPDVKLCRNDVGLPFISEPQEGYVGRKLYHFKPEHKGPILEALLAVYERRPNPHAPAKRVLCVKARAKQLPLFSGVGA